MYNFEEHTAFVESLAKNLQIPYLFSTLWLLRVFIMELATFRMPVTFFLDQNELGTLTKKPIYNISS